VNATDADSGENALIRYNIVGQAATHFNVDQRGLISAKQSLNRETDPVFHFQIVAVDNGLAPRTGSALVVVNIHDDNDERPTFSAASYSFTVPENEEPGTVVGEVHVINSCYFLLLLLLVCLL